MPEQENITTNEPFFASLFGVGVLDNLPCYHTIHLDKFYSNVDEVHRDMELYLNENMYRYTGYVLVFRGGYSKVFSRNDVISYLNTYNENYRKSLEKV